MLVNAANSMTSISEVQGAFTVLTALHLVEQSFPKQAAVLDQQLFDYIIAGGGTAGCVLARRLAEDKNTTVLLIEAGNDPQTDSNIPALMLYLRSSEESWNYTVEDLGHSRETRRPTNDDMALGRVLGGSSSVGYLLYTPGSQHDYNKLAKIVNNSMWNFTNVLPYLKKSQKLNDEELLKTDAEFFGQDGNVALVVVRQAGELINARYLKGFEELGHEIVPSINGNRTLGYTNGIFTIGDNIRQSTAVTYMTYKDKYPNLYVLKDSIVIRVVIDEYKNAVGVEVFAYKKRYLILRAKREVILSAGVVNTPKILMMSGIGPEEHLLKHNIHPIVNLPVGEGLQDQLAVTLYINMTKRIVTYRPFNPYEYPASVITGYVAFNKAQDVPDYQSVNYMNFPKNLMKYCIFTYCYKDEICDRLIATDTNTESMYSIVKKHNSKSRGRVLLQSNDYRDNPIVHTGKYSVEEDLVDFARIVMDFLKVLETKTFKDAGAHLKDPKLPACDKHNKRDLKYWMCYVLYMTTSQHQYIGTCAMGKVVDSNLNVHGIKYLRIVDACVWPFPIVGGTLGSTIMIGEKAADIIKEAQRNSE